ncbi:MAG: SpoIIE family protein phosphatase [Spirochaetaceae bacterium]
MFLDNIINLGIEKSDEVNTVRYKRQINGLNLFYTAIALSVGLISFILLNKSRVGLFLGYVQILATLMYAGNLYNNRIKFKKYVNHLTILAFELHLFLCALLTGLFDSPVAIVIVLFPLLAALVEVSIFLHLFIGLFQFMLLIMFHFIFPELENSINTYLGITESSTVILRIMGLGYFPIMSAGIINIIFAENLSARKKQKVMIKELSRMHHKLKIYADALKDESIRLKAEVNIAKDIQAMVLPDDNDLSDLSDQEVSCIMRPADEVGGDYYDVIQSDGKLVFGIGDVTGHGLASGIIMLMAQTAIKTIVETKSAKYEEYLPIVNKVLFDNINRINANRNMTLALFNYLGNGRYIATGQHEYFIIYRAKTKQIEINDTMDDGFFIGMIESVTEFSNLNDFVLYKDDILLLFSDGVTEAEDMDSNQFGLERLVQYLEQYAELPPSKIKQKIMQKIYNYIGDRDILDDISLLIIKQKECL